MDGWVGSDGGYRFNTYLFVLVVQEHLAAIICPAAVAAAAAPHHGPAAAAARRCAACRRRIEGRFNSSTAFRERAGQGRRNRGELTL